jgi:hypothetical protein
MKTCVLCWTVLVTKVTLVMVTFGYQCLYGHFSSPYYHLYGYDIYQQNAHFLN